MLGKNLHCGMGMWHGDERSESAAGKAAVGRAGAMVVRRAP